MDAERKEKLEAQIAKIEALALQIFLAKVASGDADHSDRGRFDTRVTTAFTLAENFINFADEVRKETLKRGY